jgi:hypothetical protein
MFEALPPVPYMPSCHHDQLSTGTNLHSLSFLKDITGWLSSTGGTTLERLNSCLPPHSYMP